MKISELRNGLNDIQQMLRNFGVAKQAGEIKALVDVLGDFEDLTVPELVTRIKAVSTSSKKTAPKPVDDAAVEAALRQLQGAAHLSETFNAEVAAVLKDKRLGKPELVELARRFGGTEPDKATKPGVAKYLKERRLEMKRQGGLGSTIDKMFGRTGT